MKTKIDDNRLKNIYLEITKDKGKPLDFWEISALLEIYGIRDIMLKMNMDLKMFLKWVNILKNLKI